MMTKEEHYNKGFAKGCKMVEMSDAYWLRVYAGHAIQGLLAVHDLRNESIIAADAVCLAKALIAELKKAEAQDE